MSLRDKIRNNEAIPQHLDLALRAATPIQRAGMWWRLQQKRTRVNARVISFGNITVGGTGKTPAVIERAQRETATGHKVAVVTRGYGSQKIKEPYLLAPDAKIEDLARIIGDEAALIHRRVPETYIVKSANRVAGALAAIKTWNCDTIILDDGFQAVALERDENIVLIDARNPFGNGAILPRGILREPLSQLRRATEIILTRCEQVNDLVALHYTIKTNCGSDIPIRHSEHRPTAVWRVCDGAEFPLDFLQGKTINAACAIASPEAFYSTLESLGAHLEETASFSDHAEIPREALKAKIPTLITEKDAVRMGDCPDNVYALAISLHFC